MKEHIRDAVNFAGSVASITGVSLLWLSQFYPGHNLLLYLPAFAIAALLTIGVLASAVELFQYGYRSLVADQSPNRRIIYSCFVASMLIFGASLVLGAVYSLVWIFIRDTAR